MAKAPEPKRELGSGTGLEGGRLSSADGYSANGAAREPGRGRGSALRLVAGLLIFAVGAAVFLFPVVSEMLAQREASEAISTALSADAVTETAADSGTSGKRAKDSEPAYQWLLAYNERVAAGQGGAINDPWGIGSDSDELSQVGLADGIVGSLTISSLGEQLPLYLGSNMDHLAGGVAVISGTDAPLGQAGSNCVIAGHRAKWSGLTMFRDIENVREGDTVDIETPWDSLTYRVVGFRVIDPTNQQEVHDICAIQPGRDLVTLVTCHPYGHNYQRYVVTCERVDNGAAANAAGSASALLARNPISEALQPSDSPLLVTERWLRVAGLSLMLLVVIWGLAGLVRRISNR